MDRTISREHDVLSTAFSLIVVCCYQGDHQYEASHSSPQTREVNQISRNADPGHHSPLQGSFCPVSVLQLISAVADLGGDPGVQRNPPFLAKMNLAHGGVCSLSHRRRRYYYNNVGREARRSIFRCGSSTLRGKFAPRRNSSKQV